ncbi:hypothetical protein SAY87_018357 [Trapa incisa]|uniref:Uncharacterized protein n=1 Tax=Trapa incisa TaxID=236973 RepID=A0AAN7L3X2_9MYRT|nr:hypothetical protein SAY87_018357 [Trapa incisa]
MGRNLQTLSLEESSISKNDGEWLHELALNNSVLENLNFYMTDLNKFNFENLELIAGNCQSLVSVKVGNDCEVLNLDSFFHAASSLEEFGGGFFNEKSERYTNLKYPPRLCQLGQTYIGKNEMHIVFPIAKSLKKLDLLYAFLGMEDICLLIQKCHNLEVFETMNVIGDGGVGSFMGWGWMMKEVLLKEAQD